MCDVINRWALFWSSNYPLKKKNLYFWENESVMIGRWLALRNLLLNLSDQKNEIHIVTLARRSWISVDKKKRKKVVNEN